MSGSSAIHKLPSPFGRYILLERLGVGGMAEVFRAEQSGAHGFSKEVVIKRILPHLAEDPRFVEMFLREARLAAGINHPNVVQIYDVGEVDGAYYIAMEYVDGLTVRALARRLWSQNRPLPLEIACGIIADAARGLEVIHSATGPTGRALDIVHRDISPDNLMITLHGDAKILDFGIARAKDQKPLTQTGELKGKIPYMPPEQVNSQPLDKRADLYSLGITLYWLLTRTRPFDRASDLATLNAIVREQPAPPRSKNPEIPPGLEVLILQLLQKSAISRPASGDKVAERIQRAVPELKTGEALESLIREAKEMPSAHYTASDKIPVALAATEMVPPPDERKDTAPMSVVSELPESEPRTKTSPGALDPAYDHEAAFLRSRTPLVVGGLFALVVTVPLGLYALGIFDEAEIPLRSVDEQRLIEVDKVAGKKVEVVAEKVVANEVIEKVVEELPKEVEKRRRAPSRQSWSVRAPNNVRWLYKGRVVGKGNSVLKLPRGARTVVAFDTRRRVKTQVSVKSGLDYRKLPRGKLLFRVHPFATVYLGGDKVGVTPKLSEMSAVAGTYESIKFVNGDRTMTKRATLSAGGRVTVKANLEK